MNLVLAILQPNIVKGREKCLWILVFAMFRPVKTTVWIGLIYFWSIRVTTIAQHSCYSWFACFKTCRSPCCSSISPFIHIVGLDKGLMCEKSEFLHNCSSSMTGRRRTLLLLDIFGPSELGWNAEGIRAMNSSYIAFIWNQLTRCQNLSTILRFWNRSSWVSQRAYTYWKILQALQNHWIKSLT